MARAAAQETAGDSKLEKAAGDAVAEAEAASAVTPMKPEAASDVTPMKPEAASDVTTMKPEAVSAETSIKPEAASAETSIKPKAASVETSIKPDAAKELYMRRTGKHLREVMKAEEHLHEVMRALQNVGPEKQRRADMMYRFQKGFHNQKSDVYIKASMINSIKPEPKELIRHGEGKSQEQSEPEAEMENLLEIQKGIQNLPEAVPVDKSIKPVVAKQLDMWDKVKEPDTHGQGKSQEKSKPKPEMENLLEIQEDTQNVVQQSSMGGAALFPPAPLKLPWVWTSRSPRASWYPWAQCPVGSVPPTSQIPLSMRDSWAVREMSKLPHVPPTTLVSPPSMRRYFTSPNQVKIQVEDDVDSVRWHGRVNGRPRRLHWGRFSIFALMLLIFHGVMLWCNQFLRKYIGEHHWAWAEAACWLVLSLVFCWFRVKVDARYGYRPRWVYAEHTQKVIHLIAFFFFFGLEHEQIGSHGEYFSLVIAHVVSLGTVLLGTLALMTLCRTDAPFEGEEL